MVLKKAPGAHKDNQQNHRGENKGYHHLIGIESVHGQSRPIREGGLYRLPRLNGKVWI